MSAPLTEQQGQRLLRLAREVIASRLGLVSKIDRDGLEEEQLQRSRATFVTLKKQGQLRGCIGNLEPAGSVVQSLERNALNAAFHDLRFSPLSEDEFDRVTVELSVLTAPRPLSFSGADDLLSRLRPGRDGVIIQAGKARATFLPQVWDQLPEPADFLEHLCQKAGLPPRAWRQQALQVWTYEVQHFRETQP